MNYKFHFSLIADPQIGIRKGLNSTSEKDWQSEVRSLKTCIENSNSEHPLFTLFLGDLVHDTPESEFRKQLVKDLMIACNQ